MDELLERLYALTEQAQIRIEDGMSVEDSMTYLRHDMCAAVVQYEINNEDY